VIFSLTWTLNHDNVPRPTILRWNLVPGLLKHSPSLMCYDSLSFPLLMLSGGAFRARVTTPPTRWGFTVLTSLPRSAPTGFPRISTWSRKDSPRSWSADWRASWGRGRLRRSWSSGWREFDWYVGGFRFFHRTGDFCWKAEADPPVEMYGCVTIVVNLLLVPIKSYEAMLAHKTQLPSHWKCGR